MTPQNTRAVCGTALVIASVVTDAIAGGSLTLLGMAIIGLYLLLGSLVSPPPREGGIQHGYYR